jgi:threonylcarbamoyladenosine tRNA methylthiotransferase MtaB
MPAVARDIVKERARRLREVGEAALRRHFDREVGARRAVLVELGNAGYTEQYMPVRFAAAQPPGRILNATITGHDGRQLLAA